MTHSSLRTLGALIATITLALLAGCGQHLQVNDWRQAADRYVYEQANGDIASLGDVQERGSHRVFKALGHDDPARGQDVVGVLAGQQLVDGRPWMFFVVGDVHDRQLQSSRLVAVTQSEGQLLWATGPTREQPTNAYVRNQMVRNGGAAPYEGWPEEGDRYRLRVDGSRALVTEQRSGATWALDFEENEIHPTQPPASLVTPASRNFMNSPARPARR